MIKLIGTAYKRDDFSTREFFDYWRDTHAEISARNRPIRGYVVSEVIKALDNPNNPSGENEIQVDGFVEQWWDDQESFESAMSSEEQVEAWEDVVNYAKPTGQFWIVKEHVYVPPPIMGPGTLTNKIWVE